MRRDKNEWESGNIDNFPLFGTMVVLGSQQEASTMSKPLKTIKPDNKGRIYLGKLADGISGFAMSIDAHQRIILDPLVEIPAREKWLFENKAALQELQRGLTDAHEGRLQPLDDLSAHLDEDDAA